MYVLLMKTVKAESRTVYSKNVGGCDTAGAFNCSSDCFAFFSCLVSRLVPFSLE